MEHSDTISTSIALAKKLGIELGEADFANEKSCGELSDDELDAVAGGSTDGFCVCAFAGGSGGIDNKDNNKYGCACVMYGQGGDGRPEDKNCQCIAHGWGEDGGFYFF